MSDSLHIQQQQESATIPVRIIPPQDHAQATLTQAAIPDDKPLRKRPKSLGEHLFNLTTYLGVTWVLNELLSAFIGSTIEGPPKSPKPGKLFGWFERQVERTHQVMGKIGLTRENIHSNLRVLWLTIGGTLLLPLVKLLEDHKGSLVRRADLFLEGEKGLHDPELEAAHRAMDEAPKQSWGSLIKGRLVVMGLALGLNMAAGGETAPSTRLFKGTPADKYANMERFATTFMRDILSRIHPDSRIRQNIREMRQKPYFETIAKSEGEAARLIGGTFGFVLVLSGVLSAVFFASSKFFAQRREENEKRREIIRELEKEGAIPRRHTLLDAASQIDLPGEKSPSTMVTAAVASRDRVQPRLLEAAQGAG